MVARADVPIIARRRTSDGKTVLAFADGRVALNPGGVVARGLNRESLRILMDDVSSYDSHETRALASAAKKGVAQHPNDVGGARRAMRSLVGPPVQSNPIGVRDAIFISTGVLTVIALLYEVSKKASS